MRYVIIGDGIAGHTAAETIREERPEANIRVFTKEDVPFYDRIGLRAYIRGGRSEDDLSFGGEEWYAERAIDLHLSTEVVELDRGANTVITASGEEYGYDKLLLATGGRPRTLSMEDGVEHVHHLWTLQANGRALRERLETADDGLVIGGGLLGFDLIGSFNETVDATYLIREDRWWHSVLSEEGAAIVHDAMREAGVDLRFGEEARAMQNEDGRVRVETGDAEYTADVVGVAVGNERNLELAEEEGLETDSGIICDEFLRTADEDVYVAGDAAEYHDPVLEMRNLSGSWVTAQEHGKVAGKNMAGAKESLGVVDSYTVSHFGLNVASLGDPVQTEGKEVVTAVEPDAERYRKVVLDDGRIVGAAIVGEMKWMHPLKQLIRRKIDVSEHVDALEDEGFDLKKLL